MISDTSKKCPIHIDPKNLKTDPFPHIIVDHLINSELYEKLKSDFPNDSVYEKLKNEKNYMVAGGRRNITRSDQTYHDFLNETPSWKELCSYLDSIEFFKTCVDIFSSQFERFEINFDYNNIRYSDYTPPRYPNIFKRALHRLGAANTFENIENILLKAFHNGDLYLSFDFARAQAGYEREIHLDNRNKLMVMLIYFSGQDEIGGGGELGLYQHKNPKPLKECERFPDPNDVEAFCEAAPANNRGVFFLNCNNSYHGVNKVLGKPGQYRNFIYASISARHQIW